MNADSAVAGDLPMQKQGLREVSSGSQLLVDHPVTVVLLSESQKSTVPLRVESVHTADTMLVETEVRNMRDGIVVVVHTVSARAAGKTVAIGAPHR